MTPEKDIHVFISHAWIDGTEHAKRLYDALTKRGISAWLDLTHMNPFNDFSGEIDRQIKRASHIVVCVTPDIDREDSYVRLEIGYAKGHRKPIIAALFEEVVPPSSMVNNTRAYFNRNWDAAFTQVLDYLGKPRDHEAPADDPFQDYLDALRQEIEDYLNIAIIREIPLHSQETPGAVQTTATKRMLGSLFETTLTVKPEEQKPPLAFDSIGDAFQNFGGRMLLLGEPGAGKTITMMTFARAMLASRLADRSKPLPIFARIADWDGKTALPDWLAGQLPISRDDLIRLIGGGKALLALDGLDELSNEREDPTTKEKYDPRQHFLSLLPPNTPTLVSCRVTDYAEIGQKATLKGAVTLQPLDDAQLQDYLSAQPDLWAALQADDGLRDIARTPLLLSLFAYAFNGLDDEAKALHSLARGDLRDKIFETYVRRRYDHESRKRSMPYSLEQMIAALQYGAFRGMTRENKLIDVRGGRITHDWESPGDIEMGDFVNMAGIDDTLDAPNFAVEIGHRMQAVQPLLDQARLLHILLPVGERHYRFIHLLLRDYFAFPMALTALHDPKIERRVEATRALGRIGDVRASEELTATVHDSEEVVRVNGIRALGQIGGVQAIKSLITVLGDPNGDVQLASARTLEQLGRSSAGLLVAALSEVDPSTRSQMAYILGEIADVSTIEVLIALLGDPDQFVRGDATLALRNIGTPAIEPLTAMLHSPNAFQRRGAADALGQIGDRSSVETLIATLSDEDAFVRRSATLALGELGDVRAVAPLIALLQDQEESVCWSAVEALGYLRDPQAVKPLIVLLNSRYSLVHNSVVQALKRINTPEALAAVDAYYLKRESKSDKS